MKTLADCLAIINKLRITFCMNKTLYKQLRPLRPREIEGRARVILIKCKVLIHDCLGELIKAKGIMWLKINVFFFTEC